MRSNSKASVSLLTLTHVVMQGNMRAGYHKKSFTTTSSKLQEYIISANRGKAQSVIKGSTGSQGGQTGAGTTGYSGSSIIVQQHQYNSNGSSIVYQGPMENAKNGRAGNKNFQSVSPDPLAVYKN